MESEESRPFLEVKESQYDDNQQRHPNPSHYRRHQNWLWISGIANIILVITCISLTYLLAFKHEATEDHSLPRPYSPANEAIQYEYRTFTSNSSTFIGPPTPAWETAMHDLLSNTLLALTPNDLALANTTSIPLRAPPDTYAGGLGVAHNLHCVKQLKQFLYYEHFYAATPRDSPHGRYLRYHADHCLDFVRQSLMCYVDTSLYTLAWAPSGEVGLEDRWVVKHRNPGVQKCVGWDALKGWMGGRSASMDRLVRPGE